MAEPTDPAQPADGSSPATRAAGARTAWRPGATWQLAQGAHAFPGETHVREGDTDAVAAIRHLTGCGRHAAEAAYSSIRAKADTVRSARLDTPQSQT